MTLCLLSLGLAACGDDDDCEQTLDGACVRPSNDGSGDDGGDAPADDGNDDAGMTSADDSPNDDGADDGRTDDGQADDGTADDDGPADTGQTDAGQTDAGDSEGTGADSDAGETSPADDCAGLDEDTCYAASQQGTCQPIWGTPWVDQQGEWCLFGNGTMYLGCAVAEGCEETAMTICESDSTAAWNVGLSCLPSDLPVMQCDAPGDCGI